ncbi:hypothetical protein B0F90DRAFT_1883527 [Multifurca ochricompacta]|uniref:Uncharacterized protein n=1 Tax=Multifurca ochricompacta TaxID=376703 RepID=A0AAD4LYS1_9AGAM|nr:hypothetical protein B0F90DRAFT_1883527 [Multifurca ochricompacta]
MSTTTASFLLLLLLSWWSLVITASPLQVGYPSSISLTSRSSNSRKVPPLGFYDPRDHGGNWLTVLNNTFPAGLGEPINVILLGTSDSAVLIDQQVDGGLRNYFLSIGFAGECLGQHSGSDQAANLGDGRGYQNETAVMRWNYGDPALGTCKETVLGGNHFRYWAQTGSEANSGAVFMAASYELPEKFSHDIVVNGYNLGRDWLIGNATAQSTLIPTTSLTNATTYSGQTSYGGYVYQSDVQYLSGYLVNGSDGINHYLSVGVNGTNAVDGLVALLNVKLLTTPSGSPKPSSSCVAFFSFLGG